MQVPLRSGRMLSRKSICLATALGGVAAATSGPTVGATVNNGVTDIFGNHFGRPGRNATYDYVVSAD